MKTNLPVLIGSGALRPHGFNGTPNDRDLIVSDDQAKEICYGASKKEGPMCFFNFENEVHKVDLIPAVAVNKFIWDICNTKYCTETTILFGTITAIVCPLEILYVIKKAHLHRFLPLTGNKSQDIEIWYRHVEMYEWMRQKLGYVKMDLMLYGEEKYGQPLDPKSNSISEMDLEDICRKIFAMNFDEVTARVGDTLISMEKSNDDFFTDNVERFIEHDDLHKLIALLCRKVDTVLYDDFKEDLTVANLSRKLFIGADSNKRNQCLYEECMVLVLERKQIPKIMKCHVQPRIPIKTYDKNEFYVDLKEIVAHFATNLCGQGHSWLRQYVIDHIHLLINKDVYDFDALFKIAIDVTKADLIESNIKEHNLADMLIKMQTHKIDPEYLPEIGIHYHSKDITIGTGNEIFEAEGVRITDLKTTAGFNFRSKLDYEPYQKYIEMIKEDGRIIFNKSKGNDDTWFYNVDKNIGLIIHEESWRKTVNLTIFYCKISIDKKYNVKINGEYYELGSVKNPNTFEQSFTKRYRMYYYYSSDCTECHERQNSGKSNYLSSYGSSPASVGILFEKIARHNLNLKRDFDNHHNGNSGSSGTGSGYESY